MNDIKQMQAQIKQLEKERDFYKARSTNSLSFTYEPTKERVTIYAPQRRCIDTLLFTPGLVELFRDIEKQVHSNLDFEDSNKVPGVRFEPVSLEEAIKRL